MKRSLVARVGRVAARWAAAREVGSCDVCGHGQVPFRPRYEWALLPKGVPFCGNNTPLVPVPENGCPVCGRDDTIYLATTPQYGGFIWGYLKRRRRPEAWDTTGSTQDGETA